MNCAAWIVLLAGIVTGCTVTIEQRGAQALLDDAWLPVGSARAEAIVTGLGVPDEVEATDEGFHFAYHFLRRDEERFGIVGYGLKLVTDERAEHREGSLHLWFDRSGRLLVSKLHDHTQRRARREGE